MTSSLVDSYIQSQAADFLRPRTLLERLQLLFTIAWFIFAFTIESDIQFLIFLVVLLLIIANSVQLVFQQESRSFVSSIFRFSIFFWLFLYLKGFLPTPGSTGTPYLTLYPGELGTFYSVYQFQAFLLSLLLVIGLFSNYVRFELIKSRSGKFSDNYLDFITQLFKGISYSLFLLILLVLIQWLPKLKSLGSFPNYYDLILIIGIISLLFASQGPQGTGMQQILMRELFLVPQNRYERLRDASLVAGFILLSLIHLVPLIQRSANFLSLTSIIWNNITWNEVAVLLFILGALTYILSLFEKDSRTQQRFSILSSNLANSLNDFAMPDNFRSTKESLKDSIIDPENQQFYKLTKNISIINKTKTKFTAKKDSIIIPVKETSSGTAVVLVGENELERIENGKVKIKYLDSTTTTVIIPHNAWQEIYQSLEVIKPTDELIKSLAIKGIETRDKLITLAQNSLQDFQNWNGPQALVERMQGLKQNFQEGKYGIVESPDGTNIRLPGLTIVESSEGTFVRVLGIKVLDMKGKTFVSMPFLKVMDTPDYDFVKLPGLTVIDTKSSSLVSILGFRIQEGDQKEIEDVMLQIETDQKIFEPLIENQIENILDAPEMLLLSQTTDGERIELLTGENQETALVSMESFDKKKKRTREWSERERHKKGRQGRRRVNAGNYFSNSSTSPQWVNEVSGGKAQIESGIVNSISPKSDKNQYEKFLAILNMSKGNIKLNRLARQLVFDSIEQLEDWLINSNFNSLQVEWEKNLLIITEQLIADVKARISTI